MTQLLSLPEVYAGVLQGILDRGETPVNMGLIAARCDKTHLSPVQLAAAIAVTGDVGQTAHYLKASESLPPATTFSCSR
jgi:hypothetical protein